ncbi:MAG: hypothetical protein JWN41_1833 [Thermoleophilia bacterium]|nr:hypothetical protein [Thermoleophilia bacterium]
MSDDYPRLSATEIERQHLAAMSAEWTCEYGVARAEGCRDFACGGDGYVERAHLTSEERRRLLLAHRDGVLAPGDAVLIEAERIAADRACAQDDHDRVWQAGREAGWRDALIALAEHRGAFFDELDRHIADSLRRDQEYVEAHDAAVLRSAADNLELIASTNGLFFKGFVLDWLRGHAGISSGSN